MGMVKLDFVLTGALVLGLAAVGPAAAQLAQNSDAPVDITADELEVVNAQCLATYRGGAEALQDTVRLRSDVLKIYYKPSTGPAKPGAGGACGGELDRMEAIGSVYYVTPQQRIRGDNALYDKTSDTITITGDVVAVQGQNVMRGARLVVNVATGDAQMQSAGPASKSRRIRTVLYPKQQTPAGPSAAPR